MSLNGQDGFTANLRRRLMAALDIAPCHACGQVKKRGSFRTAGRAIGVSPSTVWRFLDGEDIRSDSLDLIVKYVEKKGIPA